MPEKLKTSLKVVIIDDQPLYREGLAAVLREYFYTVHNLGAEPFQAILEKTRPFNPSLAIVGQLPGQQERLRLMEVLKTQMRLPVITICNPTDGFDFLRSSAKSAYGFLHRDSEPKYLLEAARLASNGKTFIDPLLSQRFIQLATDESCGLEGPSATKFTDRGLDILLLTGQMKSITEICDKLCITRETLESHYSKIRIQIAKLPGFEDKKLTAREMAIFYVALANYVR